MTKEQEEAIEMLEDIKNNTWTTKYIMSSDSKKAETVLNMLKEKDKIIENFERKLDKISKRNVDLINKYTELKLILAYICRIGISIDDVEIEKFIKEANNFEIRVERDVANRRTIYKTIF